MKKKILSFMLVLALIVPCMFAFGACNKEKTFASSLPATYKIVLRKVSADPDNINGDNKGYTQYTYIYGEKDGKYYYYLKTEVFSKDFAELIGSAQYASDDPTKTYLKAGDSFALLTEGPMTNAIEEGWNGLRNSIFVSKDLVFESDDIENKNETFNGQSVVHYERPLSGNSITYKISNDDYALVWYYAHPDQVGYTEIKEFTTTDVFGDITISLKA